MSSSSASITGSCSSTYLILFSSLSSSACMPTSTLWRAMLPMRTISLTASPMAMEGVTSIFSSRYAGLREIISPLPGRHFSINLMYKPVNGINSSVFTTLNAVCALAIWRAISSAGEIASTSFINSPIKVIKIMLPIKLNITCASATLLAVILARSEASTAVMQVPILSPRSTGIAPSSGIRP